MTKSYILCWAMLYNLVLSVAELNNTQQDLIVALSQSLAIKQCVIVCDKSSGQLQSMKEFSKYRILTTAISPHHFNSSKFDLKMFPLRSFVVVDVENVTNMATSTGLWDTSDFMYRFVWIVFQPHWPEEDFKPYLYIPYDCQFFVINSSDNVNYVITEIYNTYFDEERLFSSNFGVWSKEGGLVRSTVEFYQRRKDMNGTVLPVVTPFYSSGECYYPSQCACDELVVDMAHMMNFRPYYMTDEQFRLTKGKIIPEIVQRMYLFDSIGYNRDMMGPVWKVEAFLYIGYDVKYEQGNVAWYLRSFSSEMWYAILIWVIISSPVIWFINYYSHKKCRQNQQERFEFISFFFIPLDSFSSQCDAKDSTHLSARMACFMSRCLAALLNPAYSAAILSFIMTRFVVLPFTDLEGFASDGTFKIGFENGSGADLFFQESNDLTTRLVSENYLLDRDQMPTFIMEGLDKLCTNKKLAVAYFKNERMRKDALCTSLQIPKPLYRSWEAMQLRPGSPFKVIFNRNLKIFSSAGILEKTKREVFGQDIKVGAQPHEEVGIEALVPVFQALALAQVASLLILLVECWYKRIFDKKKNEMSKQLDTL